MTDHKIGTREEWLAARLEQLKAEKALPLTTAVTTINSILQVLNSSRMVDPLTTRFRYATVRLLISRAIRAVKASKSQLCVG